MKYSEGQVMEAIKSIGVDVVEQRGLEIIAHCPGHESIKGKVDRNPSWSINVLTGVHYCFSCKFKGNLQTLVGIAESAGTEPDDEISVDLGFELEEYGIPTPGFYTVNTMPEVALALMTKPPQEVLESRRLNHYAAEVYGILWNNQSWIFPYRDPHTKRLIGYQEKSSTDRRFRNRPPGVSKGSTLFGITSHDSDRVVLVESPLDAAMLYRFGFPAVAISGSHLSEQQQQLLVDRYSYVVLALDNDDAGRKETRRLESELSMVKFQAVEYQEGDPKDVGEMEHAEFVQRITEAGF